MQIGILDDNPAMCHFLESVLVVEGHQVCSSTDSASFISLVCSPLVEHWGCIIVDFHLSRERGGTDVIRQVRQRYPHLPAILVSAGDIPPSALEGLPDVRTFHKPFYPIKLFALLKTFQAGTNYERIRVSCELQRHQCEVQRLWITEQRRLLREQQAQWEQCRQTWEEIQEDFSRRRHVVHSRQSHLSACCGQPSRV